MSDSDRSLHDSVIETVEECENDEPSSPRHPVEHHTDNGNVMGSYNGDSFAVSGSPFKKSYSTSSLEEASVDSLVDEPLPIESVALSPFRIDTIHNSPLSSRQKDSHTFSVSVSDSLPPHVMELDSPEHYGDKTDEPYGNEFCVDKIPPPMKMSEEEEEFLIGPKTSTEVVTAQSEPTESLESILTPSQEFQRQRDQQASWQEEQTPETKNDDLPLSSQEDLFESQDPVTEKPCLPVTADVSKKEQKHVAFSEDLPQKETSPCGITEDDLLMDEDFIPPSDGQSYSKNPLHHPFKTDVVKSVVLPLSVTDTPSPVKRKREESPEEGKSSEEKTFKRDRKEKSPEEVDSDIEILEQASFSSANQSVEVVYDKKSEFDSEAVVESQDLRLILTGETQSEIDRCAVSPSEKDQDKDSSQSQSLLSMPDSENLTCNERVSSCSFAESSHVESTIRSTQIELLCQPAAHISQPNIEPLIILPILQGMATSNGSNESTNNISSSNSSSSSSNDHSAVKEKKSDTPVDSPVQFLKPQISTENSTPEKDVSETSVSFPHFDTPQITQQSQEGDEESLFVKAVKAAEKKQEEERSLISTKEKDKDSFDTFPSLIEEAGSKDSPSVIESADSNNSTPVCVINPTRSSQSTPISSQPMEPSTRWLFSKISQEHSSLGDQASSQKVNVSAGDSDEERDEKDKDQHGRHRGKITSSTPNVSDKSVSPESLKDEQSNITKDSKVNSTVNSSLNPNNSESTKNDTQLLESDAIHSLQDMVDAGWIKVGLRKYILPFFEVWESPTTKELMYSVVGENEIVKESTPFSSVLRFASSSKSSSSKDSRISDISSISRITSSSGYLGDKSSSSSNPECSRHESTRLSMASVCTISPPHSSRTTVDSGLKKLDDEPLFILPPPRAPLPHTVPKVVDVDSPEKLPAAPPYDNSSTSSSTDSSNKSRFPRSRGRPRGRGRGRGRGRDEEKKVAIPPVIKEDDFKVGEVVDSQSMPLSQDDYEGDDFYSILPKFLQEKLRNVQIPMTEDEEEMFILQKNQINKSDQKTQFEEVLRKVRIADIRPDLLVFARYFDKNYYSAIIKESAKEDRWKVQYNLDGCINDVREVYILPTEILPNGTACHVRHPNQNFSDPGIVKGHICQKGILIHVIELHKGQILKATHSHIILSPEVATALNESRLSFRSMIASPGGDVSLDNIVPGKRRRETSTSPQKRLQMAYTPSPRPRKADYNLDTSDAAQDSKKRVSKSKESKRVPTAFSETSISTDPETLPTPVETPPKSSKKRVAKKTQVKSTPSTPKTKTTKKQASKKLTEISAAREQVLEAETPKSSKVGEGSVKKSSKKKETASKTRKKPAGEGREETPKKSSKRLFLKGDLDIKTSGKPKESLLNPVVELIQLEEVSASPRSSPRSTPKKRGRRPGSATKNPKKAMKVEQEDVSGEAVEDIDPRLGPLPPSGCNIFQGYTFLITRAANPQNQNSDEELFLPMNREYLRKQICSAGGKVVDTFEEAYMEHLHYLQMRKSPAKDDYNVQFHMKKALPANESPSKIVCVSNSYCRTAKYIQCLTVGIPLVNMNWVISSLMKNVCHNWLSYLLPAGLSLMTGTVMEQTFGDSFKDATSTVGKVVEVLKGEKVFLATSTNPEFGELWLNLLTAADAVVFKMPPKGGNIQRLIDRRTSVVIADSSIPEEELKRARDANVPIVSSEWFIQSLLARCKLPYDAQPDFRHDHKRNKNIPQRDDGGESER